MLVYSLNFLIICYWECYATKLILCVPSAISDASTCLLKWRFNHHLQRNFQVFPDIPSTNEGGVLQKRTVCICSLLTCSPSIHTDILSSSHWERLSKHKANSLQEVWSPYVASKWRAIISTRRSEEYSPEKNFEIENVKKKIQYRREKQLQAYSSFNNQQSFIKKKILSSNFHLHSTLSHIPFGIWSTGIAKIDNGWS